MAGHITIGIDEVGWGCLAGPLTAAACYIPDDPKIHRELKMIGFTDSKVLTKAEREEMAVSLIKNYPEVLVEVYHLSVEDYDELGPSMAWNVCLRRATKLLLGRLNFWDADKVTIIVDGDHKIAGLPEEWEQIPIPHADALDLRCSVASVLAKVKRDLIMAEYARLYPHYGFDTNVGYPTKEHKMALFDAGPLFPPYVSDYIHRKRLLHHKMINAFLSKHWKKAPPKWIEDRHNWLTLRR